MPEEVALCDEHLCEHVHRAWHIAVHARDEVSVQIPLADTYLVILAHLLENCRYPPRAEVYYNGE